MEAGVLCHARLPWGLPDFERLADKFLGGQLCLPLVTVGDGSGKQLVSRLPEDESPGLDERHGNDVEEGGLIDRICHPRFPGVHQHPGLHALVDTDPPLVEELLLKAEGPQQVLVPRKVAVADVGNLEIDNMEPTVYTLCYSSGRREQAGSWY